MRVSLRAKLTKIVWASAVAFLVLILASTLRSRRAAQELITIEERYLPRVELGPKLDTHFARLRRSFQDAVAARDLDALARTRELLRGLREQGTAPRHPVAPATATGLRTGRHEH